MSPREAAAAYISRGWYPVRLKPGLKQCVDSDWLDRIYEASDFREGDNVGIRLVNAADPRQVKLCGVDVDAPEAVEAALRFLPPTGASWGRPSKALSQALYVSPHERAAVFKDPIAGTTLVEIRVNHQSMAPPSTHPSGEALEWRNGGLGNAPEVDPRALTRAVRLTATAAMVARYYAPAGGRHDWTLALAGALRSLGITEAEALDVVDVASRVAGDAKRQDRPPEVRGTYGRADGPTTGSVRLADLMGEVGKKFVAALRRIWGEEGGGGVFAADDKGRVFANNQANVRKAIEMIGVSLSYDSFACRMMIQRGEAPPEPLVDRHMDRMWLEIDSKFGFRAAREFFDTVVRDAVGDAPYHPVRDYLRGLKWDGEPRLDGWLARYGGAEASDYVRTVGSIVLIAAVKRATHPGCKFDEMLVLESAQGQNKSTALQVLCPREDWFSNDLPLGVDTKEVIERTSGKWIVEAAEMTNMRNAQVEQLKAFLSRQVDGPVRMAYARIGTEVPRQFVIVGTTNSVAYLRDSTGNRRFWPVEVGRFDVDALARDRDQLWAEARVRAEAGASIRMGSEMWGHAETEQERRRHVDPWEPVVAELVSSLELKSNGKFPPHENGSQRVVPQQVWSAIGKPVGYADSSDMGRVNNIMQSLGFGSMVVRDSKRDGGTGADVRGWGRDMEDGRWVPRGRQVAVDPTGKKRR